MKTSAFFRNTTLEQRLTDWMKENWIFILGSFLLYQLVSVYSVGALHQDEHFQILEFMNYKIGGIDSSELPWEFEARIRPWLQPGLYFGIHKFLSLFGSVDPFQFSQILRSFSALLGWILTLTFLRVLPLWIKSISVHSYMKLVLCFSFFIPAFYARTSSEHFSGVFFWFGLCLIAVANSKSVSRKYLIFVGALWGMAFEFRYQTGLFIAGFGFWHLFFGNRGWRDLVPIALGIFSVLFLSVFVDYWGYSEWVFPPWNYLYVNLVEGVAESFGREPWYQYFIFLSNKIASPFGIIVSAALLTFWAKFPRHILTIPAALFFIIHCLLSHKEFRFLIPLLYIVPVYTVLLIEHFGSLNQNKKSLFMLSEGFLYLLFVLNIIYIFKYSFRPARDSVLAAEYLSRHLDESNVIGWVNEDPFLFPPHPMYFYKPKALHSIQIKQERDLHNLVAVHKHVFLFEFVTPSSPKTPVPNYCTRQWEHTNSFQWPKFLSDFEFAKKSQAAAHYRRIYFCNGP